MRLNAEVCKAICVSEIEAGAWAGPEEKGRKMFGRMLEAAQRLPARTLPEDAPDGPRTRVWSDLHVGHANIIRHGERPFDDRGGDGRRCSARGPAPSARKAGSSWSATRRCCGPRDRKPGERFASMPGRESLLVFGNHDVTRIGAVEPRGFDRIFCAVCADGDPPLLTHLPMRNVPAGAVNVHGHAHQAPARNSPYINVSVEHLECKPAELARLRTLARELVAGRYPAGRTTAERLREIGA